VVSARLSCCSVQLRTLATELLVVLFKPVLRLAGLRASLDVVRVLEGVPVIGTLNTLVLVVGAEVGVAFAV